jgi:hypothetical protein
MKYTRRRVLAGLAVGFATVACGPAVTIGATPATGTSGRPADTPPPTAAPCVDPRAYLQFVINVHDTVHVDESAATLLKAIGLFDKYGVAGDFYLTGPMARLYARSYPEVIERLKAGKMTVSYHVRPPHPLYTGFDQRLRGLSDTQLRQTLLDYETYGLDLATGDLLRGEPGGYSYVAQLIGRNPVVVAAPNDDQRIKTAALDVYKSLGAKMAIFFHEVGTKPGQPFEYRNGLLARPSDFSITRWKVGTLASKGGDGDPFWWNMLTGAHAAEYNPTAYLKQRMAGWTYERPPLVTTLIHENNFARSGAEAWTLRYFTDTEKGQPLSPPYNMDARDASKPRSQAEQDAIWAAYEELVAYAAKDLRVATSDDILALAAASGTDGKVASICRG